MDSPELSGKVTTLLTHLSSQVIKNISSPELSGKISTILAHLSFQVR